MEEPHGLRIAADHPIERDDGCGGKLRGNVQEIALDESHSIRPTQACRFIGGRRDVSRGQVDAHGAGLPLLEKFEGYGTYAAADVEQQTLHGLRLREAGQQQARRRSRAVGAVLLEIVRGPFRIELPFGAVANVRTAACHHQCFWPAPCAGWRC